MLAGFKTFLLKTNALALAVGVIIGAAVGKVVSSLVADILMPVISLIIPNGDWRSLKLILKESTAPDGKPIVNSLNYGLFIGNVVDFVIIALCVYLITRAFLKEPPPPETKACPKCTEIIALNATKCKFCTADL
jgi:large conductance mechanosensitive channel